MLQPESRMEARPPLIGSRMSLQLDPFLYRPFVSIEPSRAKCRSGFPAKSSVFSRFSKIARYLPINTVRRDVFAEYFFFKRIRI